jgi:hypothetical protein
LDTFKLSNSIPLLSTIMNHFQLLVFHVSSLFRLSRFFLLVVNVPRTTSRIHRRSETIGIGCALREPVLLTVGVVLNRRHCCAQPSENAINHQLQTAKNVFLPSILMFVFVSCCVCVALRGSISFLLFIHRVDASKHFRGIGVVVKRRVRLLSHRWIVARKQRHHQ